MPYSPLVMIRVSHSVADEELVADLEPVDVIAGVESQEVAVGHVVVLGDDAPDVAFLDDVGDLAGLGAVEQEGDFAQVGEFFHGEVALADLNALDEVDGHGVLVAVGGGDLIKEFVQSALSLGGADELAADVEGRSEEHTSELQSPA